MRLQLNQMAEVAVFLFDVRDQGDGGRTPWLGKFEHFEHPVRNIAESFLSYELQNSAVGEFRAILETEDKRIFVFRGHKMVELVES